MTSDFLEYAKTVIKTKTQDNQHGFGYNFPFIWARKQAAAILNQIALDIGGRITHYDQAEGTIYFSKRIPNSGIIENAFRMHSRSKTRK